MERQIDALEAALQRFTRDANPIEWSGTNGNLGTLYYNRQQGNRANNIERAIQAWENTLSVYTKESHGHWWALAQFDLGKAYYARLVGNPAENLDRAIEAWENALTIFTPERNLREWATTVNNVGRAYTNRIHDNRDDNIARAIQLLNEALNSDIEHSMPELWEQVQANLGDAWEAALTVYTRDNSPQQWADLQSKLASAYIKRSGGDRVDQLERAVQALQAALTVFTREAYPQRWADTRLNLALAYHNLATSHREHSRGDTSDNIEQAIKHYHLALQMLSLIDVPAVQAIIEHDLGNAYRERGQGDQADNLEQAIRHFQLALKVMPDNSAPELWGGTQNMLGVTYSLRLRGEPEANLKQAIEHFHLALQIFTRESYSVDWAWIQTNLGDMYAKVSSGSRLKNLERALQSYEAALAVFKPESFPSERAEVLRHFLDLYAHAVQVGRQYVEQQQCSEAYDTIQSLKEAMERAYAGVERLETNWRLMKWREVEASAPLYELMVEICLNLEPPRLRESFLYADAARSQLLLRELYNFPLSVQDLRFRLLGDLLGKESNALRSRQSDDLAAIQTNPDEDVSYWRDQGLQARAHLESLWDALAQAGATEYAALRRGDRPGWEELQRWLTDQRQAAQPRLVEPPEWLATRGRRIAVLEFFTTEDRTIAFVIRKDDADPKVIPLQVSSQQMQKMTELLSRPPQEYGSGRLPSVRDVRTGGRQPRANTSDGLTAPWLKDVMAHLDGVELLYIVPHGWLHNVPLHALVYDGMPLIEFFPIVYAPSAAVARRVTAGSLGEVNLGRVIAHGSLVVGNPTGDLPFAEAEARTVAQMVGVRPFVGKEATKGQVLFDLTGKTHLHFAAHAFFSPAARSLDSGIVMADGEILRASDLLNEEIDARLLVVSACQSGVQAVVGGELMGLARAFLIAGAASMLMTLWTVNDSATASFMRYFYGHLYNERIRYGHMHSGRSQKASVAEALRLAVLDMRAEQPDPYCWAPFILIGDWR